MKKMGLLISKGTYISDTVTLSMLPPHTVDDPNTYAPSGSEHR
jgi:hypothetical protein